MFWRGARPGYHAKVDPEYDLSTAAEADLQDQIDEYEHKLRRILTAQGIDLNPLSTQVSDPSSHIDAQIQMISAITGIPKRILTGSERGELASGQDQDSWDDLIEDRREEFATPQIIRPFVDRCIEYGVLPQPSTGEYSVEWPDMRTRTDGEKASVGQTRAQALQAYVANTAAEDVVPPEAFFRYFLGLGDEEITLINEMRDAAVKEEEADIEPEAEPVEPEPEAGNPEKME
jgi:hypothetical protein